jgi:hypothetical protein
METIQILKIYFDQNFKAKEVRLRKEFIEGNKIFSHELLKLSKQIKNLSDKQIEENLYLKILKSMNIERLLVIIDMINVCTNILWISRDRVNRFELYIKITKEVIFDLIEESNINKHLDGFIQMSLNKEKSFKKLNKINLDNFINR